MAALAELGFPEDPNLTTACDPQWVWPLSDFAASEAQGIPRGVATLSRLLRLVAREIADSTEEKRATADNGPDDLPKLLVFCDSGKYDGEMLENDQVQEQENGAEESDLDVRDAAVRFGSTVTLAVDLAGGQEVSCKHANVVVAFVPIAHSMRLERLRSLCSSNPKLRHVLVLGGDSEVRGFPPTEHEDRARGLDTLRVMMALGPLLRQEGYEMRVAVAAEYNRGGPRAAKARADNCRLQPRQQQAMCGDEALILLSEKWVYYSRSEMEKTPPDKVLRFKAKLNDWVQQSLSKWDTNPHFREQHADRFASREEFADWLRAKAQRRFEKQVSS